MFSCPKTHLCITYCQEGKTPQVQGFLVPGESLYWSRGVHLSDTLITFIKQGWGGWAGSGLLRAAAPSPPAPPEGWVWVGGGGWALPLAGAPVQGLSPGAYGGFWGGGSQPRTSRVSKPTELLASYCNDFFLPELPRVKLNDTTGELPLSKKIFHCIAAISTLQKCKREKQG